MTVLDYLPPLQMSRAWPDLLIDGGYTNNLPVDVMHGLFKPKFVVGVDVENKAADEKLMRVSYYGAHLNGWWLLAKRITEWLKGGWVAAAAHGIKGLFNAGRPVDSTPEFFQSERMRHSMPSICRGEVALC
jgi:predicted acylesterase/phospholipase RssA